MQQPSKQQHRKWQKGRIGGVSTKGSSLCFGTFGIKAIQAGAISAKHIESVRILLTRVLGKNGKLWIRVFPDVPFTRKPAGVRMGSGKGDQEFFGCKIRPGVVLFEVSGVPYSVLMDVFKVVGDKLPIKIKVIKDRELANIS